MVGDSASRSNKLLLKQSVLLPFMCRFVPCLRYAVPSSRTTKLARYRLLAPTKRSQRCGPRLAYRNTSPPSVDVAIIPAARSLSCSFVETAVSREDCAGRAHTRRGQATIPTDWLTGISEWRRKSFAAGSAFASAPPSPRDSISSSSDESSSGTDSGGSTRSSISPFTKGPTSVKVFQGGNQAPDDSGRPVRQDFLRQTTLSRWTKQREFDCLSLE